MADRDVAAALERIEELEAEVTELRRRGRRIPRWLMLFVLIIAGASSVFALAILFWLVCFL